MKNKTLAEMKEREKQARRELIIDAAERVFSTTPFDRVSVRDIAREAGISHALIYHYFPDQQSLFVEAFFRGSGEIIEIIRRRLDSGAEIETVTDCFIEYLAGHDHYFRMMTHFMLDGTLSGELLDRMNDMERRLFDQIQRVFDAAGREDARLYTHALFASLNGILITFRNYPGRSRDEVLGHMKRIGRVIAGEFSSDPRRSRPPAAPAPDTHG